MRLDCNSAEYVGIDIVEVARVAGVVSRWGERFLRRVYTASESERYGKRLPSLAARLAAKEAVMKALGCGRRGVAWREIEVLSLPGGRPSVSLYGRAEEKARVMGIAGFSISLSHTKDYAVAVVLGLKKMT
jgi:holo-[acyl-carrier protein] synthase